MTKLYCDFETQTYTIREPEQSNDRWAHRGDYGANVYLRGVSLKEYRSSGCYDDIEVPFQPKVGDRVYVVYCKYTIGSTFGTTGGYRAVAGIFRKSETAAAARQRIDEHYRYFHKRSGSQPRPKPNSNFKDENSVDLKDDDGNSYKVYVSWTDYFGGLDSIELESADIVDSNVGSSDNYRNYR